MSEESIIKTIRCIGCDKKIPATALPLCLECKVFLRFAIGFSKSKFQSDLHSVDKNLRNDLVNIYKNAREAIETGEPQKPIVFKGDDDVADEKEKA